MKGKWARRLLKAAGYGGAVLMVLLAGAVTMTVGWRPVVGPKARPLTALRFEPTGERLDRGRYLVETVSACFACHTRYDPSNPAESYPKARKGGGNTMDAEGMPWLVAPNITPDPETGAGAWSDDMLARAIREGIGHDGRALFPMMPYENYRNYSDEDVASIVVYLRSIPAVRNPLPKSEIPFPLSRLINTVPEPLTAAVPEPDLTTKVKRGEYLVKVGDCAGCHTPRGEQGQKLKGLDFGGGNTFEDGRGGVIATMNLTPDPTGISYYDEPLFVSAIRTGHVKARPLSPAMPWWIYRNMKDEDLKAVFAYLRTLKPVEHVVDNTEPPTHCKLCGHKHGLGAKN
ncbi:MAG TPA: c-type cytochrome [Pyrinomonadaceae bacterium]|jgi:mono/diheme cytochrome c family protein|nr:c-type cytochrome [Pyrinomonadaceae bacterium]